MPYANIVWDDGPDGNTEHIAEHGISKDEVEDVLGNPKNKRAKSRSSGRPIVFGYTASGRYIGVIFEEYDDDPPTIYPITAFEPDPLYHRRP